jgi:hypothetical protein
VPDWNALIRERIGDLRLASALEGEVVAELSSHLQELYESLVADGLCKPDAILRSLEEVDDWRQLARKIRRAKREKGIMNHRTKVLWLPGLISLTASMTWLMAVELTNLLPGTTWLHGGSVEIWYALWLLGQPVVGAVAAYLSRRAGGTLRDRIGAALLTSVVMFGVMGFVGVMAWLVEKNPYLTQHPSSLFFALLIWAVVPAFALLIGTVPFLKSPKLSAA